MKRTERARNYLKAIELGATGERLATFFHPDVKQIEFPNRLVTAGAERDLEMILEGALKGQAVLSSQTYEIHRCYESGDTVILEVTWKGILAVPMGSLQPGETMTARFAVFLDFEGDLIREQRNYDCFEAF